MKKDDWLKITEEKLKSFLKDKLTNEGYTINELPKDPNLDIESIKNGNYCLIEVKGSEKPNGNFFDSSQENQHFSKALFQLISKFEVYGPNSKYIIAIPYFGKTIKFIKQIPTAIKRLGIEFWVVDKDMKIKVYD